jgi:hypothetical protein
LKIMKGETVMVTKVHYENVMVLGRDGKCWSRSIVATVELDDGIRAKIREDNPKIRWRMSSEAKSDVRITLIKTDCEMKRGWYGRRSGKMVYNTEWLWNIICDEPQQGPKDGDIKPHTSGELDKRWFANPFDKPVNTDTPGGLSGALNIGGIEKQIKKDEEDKTKKEVEAIEERKRQDVEARTQRSDQALDQEHKMKQEMMNHGGTVKAVTTNKKASMTIEEVGTLEVVSVYTSMHYEGGLCCYAVVIRKKDGSRHNKMLTCNLEIVSDWYSGELMDSDEAHYAFIRLRRTGNTITSNCKVMEEDNWGKDVRTSPRAPFEFEGSHMYGGDWKYELVAQHMGYLFRQTSAGDMFKSVLLTEEQKQKKRSRTNSPVNKNAEGGLFGGQVVAEN